MAYIVLILAAGFDLVSLLQAVRQLRADAQLFGHNMLDQLLLTSDPTVRAVVAEDAAAIFGDAIAFMGIALHQATGSPIPDGVAALVIGLLVAAVAVQLARRNHDFLLGEQAPPAVRADVERFLVGFPGIVAVRELLVSFVGPRRVRVLARVDIDDDLRGDEVEALTRSVEAGLEWRSPYIIRVDIVPAGAASPGGAATATTASQPADRAETRR